MIVVLIQVWVTFMFKFVHFVVVFCLLVLI